MTRMFLLKIFQTLFSSRVLVLFTLTFGLSLSAQDKGVPQTLMYQGILNDASGEPITTPVIIHFNIYAPAGPCYVYQDTQVVTPTPTGIFAVTLGLPGNSTGPANSFIEVFNNDSIGLADSCAGTYVPGISESRRLEVVVDGLVLGGGQTFGASAFSLNTQRLSGLSAQDFVQVKTAGGLQLSQANLQTVFNATNYPELLSLLMGSSSQYMVSSPSAPMDLNSQVIQNVGAPALGTDATNKNYVDARIAGGAADTASLSVLTTGDSNKVLTWDGAQWVAGIPTAVDASKLPLSGGTMTGVLDMGGQQVLGTGHITQSTQSTMTFGAYDNAEELLLLGALTPANAGAMWYNSDKGKLIWWDGSAPALELSDGAGATGDITGVLTSVGSGLSGGATSNDANLQVVVDNSTLEISTNTVQLKDGGVTSGKLANSGVIAATYGSATEIPRLVIDAKGRVTGASLNTLTESDPKLQTLTGIEVDQLENLDAVTVSGAQWGYLGALTGPPLEVFTSANLDNVFSTSGLLKRTGASTYVSVADASGNWNTAFGWGNHGLAGYAADSAVVHKSGDALSGAVSITGSADAVQLGVQAHSTQTTNTNILELKSAAGTVVGSFPASGTIAGATDLVTKGYFDGRMATSGSAGQAASNSGTSASVARADHTHKVFYTANWFFSGNPTVGVQPQRMIIPQGATDCVITNSKLTANTPPAPGILTYNIEKCTGVGGTCATASEIYSANRTLPATTETIEGGAPDNATIAGGDVFRVNLPTIGVTVSNVSVIMTYKCENTF